MHPQKIAKSYNFLHKFIILVVLNTEALTIFSPGHFVLLILLQITYPLNVTATFVHNLYSGVWLEKEELTKSSTSWEEGLLIKSILPLEVDADLKHTTQWWMLANTCTNQCQTRIQPRWSETYENPHLRDSGRQLLLTPSIAFYWPLDQWSKSLCVTNIKLPITKRVNTNLFWLSNPGYWGHYPGLTLTLPGPSAGVSGSLDSYCSLKSLCSGMGEVVPARTSPTLLPPSPRTVLSLSCFKVLQCINCRD